MPNWNQSVRCRYTRLMLKFKGLIWNALFQRDKSASRLPWWLIPPVRFGYLVSQEFSRNRCPEKASALGFQTVFSLIPAFALALFFFRVFNFSDVGPKVEQFLFRRLNIDKITLRSSLPESTPEAEAKPPDAPNGAKATPTEPQESNRDMDRAIDPTTPQADAAKLPDESTANDRDTLKLDREIQALVDRVNVALSSGGFNTLLFGLLVGAALQLALTIEKNMNEIWGSTGQRRLFRRIAVYWSLLTLGPLLIGLSIYLARQVGVTSGIQELAVSVAGPLLALYLMYQWMPSAVVHPLSAIAGAFAAAVLLQAASVLFGMYVTHAVGYEKLYGNLGLLPLFLFWLWIIWVIVLVGAEVAYTTQNLQRLIAEERRRFGRPFIQPGLVALGLVLHAGRAFRSGKGPVGADDLAESSDLPDKLWLRLVNLLRGRGILVEAGPDGSRYIPGRPLESLRVEEIFAAVDDELVARPDENWHPEHQQLKYLTDLLAQSRQRELGKTSIADLLAMDAKPAGDASKKPDADAS